jgi:hypothetical protein
VAPPAVAIWPAEQSLGVRSIFVDEQPDRGHTGVVDQHVQSTDALLSLGQKCLETVRIANVQCQADRSITEFGRHLRGCGAIDVANRHRHACAQARFGRRATDTAATAGDCNGSHHASLAVKPAAPPPM